MYMDLLVSVIIPVYNVQQYLREAIESVLCQTFQNLEIIIVDDGSSDGSGEICDEYRSDPRVKVIHQENQGLSAARNTGLDIMTGDIVAFLDSDDAYLPDMIQTMTDAMEREGADIAICRNVRICTEGRMQNMQIPQARENGSGSRQETLTGTEALRQLIKGRFDKGIDHTTWNKVYAASLWKDIRFPVGRICEDTFTTYKLLASAGKVVVIPDVLILYRLRKGSLSQTFSVHNLRDYFDAVRQLEDYVQDHVPAVFSEDELRVYREKNLLVMIMKWAQIPVSSQREAEDLRKMILEESACTSLSSARVRSQIALLLIRYAPTLAPLFWSASSVLRPSKQTKNPFIIWCCSHPYGY